MRLAILGASAEGPTRFASLLTGLDRLQLPQSLRRIQPYDGHRFFSGEPPANRTIRDCSLSCFNRYIDDLEGFEAGLPENTLVAITLTPLQIAVNHDVLQGDSSLYPLALKHHSRYLMHLLLGHDAREISAQDQQIDIRLREVMDQNGIGYATVYGQGLYQAEQALSAISSTLALRDTGPQPSSWCWTCESCSDSRCEHQLFSALLRANSQVN